jgi:UDP-2,3-diacylglucosamine pyrophosphatase LpxH
MFISKRVSRNVQEIRFQFPTRKTKQYILALSDIHFDNPSCNRDLLKEHLDEAKKRQAAICVFGDFHCCMQGGYDPRKSRGPGAIRPEDDYPDYFDRIITNAAKWWKPYAKNLVVVCPGNHETAILKRQEIDLIDRFAMKMRDMGGITAAGGYGNFIRVYGNQHSSRFSTVIYSHHGYGAGGAWSRQTTAFLKYLEQVEADIYIAGHIHKKETFPVERAYLNKSGNVRTKSIHFIRCGTYKNEFKDGAGGWSIEKGIGPRPLGGYWIEFTADKDGMKRKIYEA